MDATHLHLLLTHYPIVGTSIGLLILAYGLYSNNDILKKVAFVIFIFMAILTIPVFLTGEEAEETVEHIAGVSENIIEEHEELAEKAIWLMGLLGVLSLISFYAVLKKLSFSRIITMITMVVSLGVFGIFVQVGNYGGKIRHSEIRSDNASTQNQDSEGIFKKHEEEEDDDDD